MCIQHTRISQISGNWYAAKWHGMGSNRWTEKRWVFARNILRLIILRWYKWDEMCDAATAWLYSQQIPRKCARSFRCRLPFCHAMILWYPCAHSICLPRLWFEQDERRHGEKRAKQCEWSVGRCSEAKNRHIIKVERSWPVASAIANSSHSSTCLQDAHTTEMDRLIIVKA